MRRTCLLTLLALLGAVPGAPSDGSPAPIEAADPRALFAVGAPATNGTLAPTNGTRTRGRGAAGSVPEVLGVGGAAEVSGRESATASVSVRRSTSGEKSITRIEFRHDQVLTPGTTTNGPNRDNPRTCTNMACVSHRWSELSAWA